MQTSAGPASGADPPAADGLPTAELVNELGYQKLSVIGLPSRPRRKGAVASLDPTRLELGGQAIAPAQQGRVRPDWAATTSHGWPDRTVHIRRQRPVVRRLVHTVPMAVLIYTSSAPRMSCLMSWLDWSARLCRVAE